MFSPIRSRTAYRVLAAIESAECHAARLALGRRRVDLVLEPRDEFGDRAIVRALGASRRHQTAAQLANDLLGNLGVLVYRVEIQC